MLELYNFPMSTCSQKVRIALAEKTLEWKDHRIESGEHLKPEYLKLNPNGVVPTLVHDGMPIRRNRGTLARRARRHAGRADQ